MAEGVEAIADEGTPWCKGPVVAGWAGLFVKSGCDVVEELRCLRDEVGWVGPGMFSIAEVDVDTEDVVLVILAEWARRALSSRVKRFTW